MPAAYGIERTTGEGMLAWGMVDEWLAKSRNYWVATTRSDGRPHAAPVWGLWLDGSFYFSTDPGSRKARNIAAHAEVVVHLESGDDVVILEGGVERVADRPSRQRFVDEYEAKYQFRVELGNADYGIYRVRPRVAFAWREGDFPTSATRWRLDGG